MNTLLRILCFVSLFPSYLYSQVSYQAVDVPGAAMARSSDLENHWRFKASDPENCRISLDRGEKRTGAASLRVDNRSGASWTLSSAKTIPVKSGGRYLAAVWVMVESDPPDYVVELTATGYVGDRRWDRSIYRSGGQFGAADVDGWTRIRCYIDVPDQVDRVSLVVSGKKADSIVHLNELTFSQYRPKSIRRTPVQGYAVHRVKERWDRGLLATRTDRGVYLSWRLFEEDPDDIGFDVYRQSGNTTPKRINQTPVRTTTDFLDQGAPEDRSCRWYVVPAGTGNGIVSPESVAASEKRYHSVPVEGVDGAQKIAIGDLDGDGKMDFVLKTPRTNIDPSPKTWKKSRETYKLIAVRHDGKKLWTHDLGWGIPTGVWFSPYVVADLDGDGKAEVVVKTTDGDYRREDGRVMRGPEYLTILDGETGRQRAQIDWPEREDRNFTHANRNHLCVAYLDGKTPCLIVERGTYNLMQVVAYQFHRETLKEIWRWDNMWEPANCWGQGAHSMHAFDVDGDGRDEIILGSLVLDDDGSVLWTTGMGHPDHVYVGDLDPTRPGLEMYFGMETAQQKNGICMVDPKTGQLIWGYPKPTTHIHSQGMCSDIDARYPGCEVWAGDKFDRTVAWMSDAKGRRIPTSQYRGCNIKAIWWDGSLQRRVVMEDRRRGRTDIVVHPTMQTISTLNTDGSPVLYADLLGDWREELVYVTDGEIRIYSTTIPAKDRRATFLQDPNYRATLYESSMGYLQQPLPSNDLLLRKKELETKRKNSAQ